MTNEQSLLESLRSAVELSCKPQNSGRIERARNFVLAMPRPWVLEHVGDVAEEVLNLADYWEYRRLLELLDLLDPELVHRFIPHGLASIDPDVREAAMDFQRRDT